jgi:hypothetical protein
LAKFVAKPPETLLKVAKGRSALGDVTLIGYVVFVSYLPK